MWTLSCIFLSIFCFSLIDAQETDDNFGCPFGWTAGVYEFRCYKYFNRVSSWYDAQDACDSEGALLPQINTKGANNFLSSLGYMAQAVDKNYQPVVDEDGDPVMEYTVADKWIGLHNSKEDPEWVWTSGEPVTYTNWQFAAGSAEKDPDGLDVNLPLAKDVHCVSLQQGTKQWSDRSCASPGIGYHFVCVLPPYPTSMPTGQPSGQPSMSPTAPTSQPSSVPTRLPFAYPTSVPSQLPSTQPTSKPSFEPSAAPTNPTSAPSSSPSARPTTEAETQANGVNVDEKGLGMLIGFIIGGIVVFTALVGLMYYFYFGVLHRKFEDTKTVGSLSMESLGDSNTVIIDGIHYPISPRAEAKALARSKTVESLSRSKRSPRSQRSPRAKLSP